MNHYTVTAPDGTIHTRNTKNHTYNYVVLRLRSKETRIAQLLEAVASYKVYLAEAYSKNNEEEIARWTGHIALAHKGVRTATDAWFVEGWRRDYDSALQLCKKTGSYASVDQAIVMETTQVG